MKFSPRTGDYSVQIYIIIITNKTENTRRIGVLWSGDHLFEGTVETLEMLRSKGIASSPIQTYLGCSCKAQDLSSGRQTNSIRYQQQHQVSHRLPKEARVNGYPGFCGKIIFPRVLCLIHP